MAAVLPAMRVRPTPRVVAMQDTLGGKKKYGRARVFNTFQVYDTAQVTSPFTNLNLLHLTTPNCLRSDAISTVLTDDV